jgi:alginate O-acetyltransferase complex protein AlgI
MNVTALSYVVFLALLWPLVRFFRSPRSRQVLLLAASYFFYFTWSRWWLAILIVSSLSNILLGQWLRRRPVAARLWTAVGFNLVLLLVLHYLGPQLASIPALQRFLLPVGISFWSFQALSYLFDVYAGEALDPTLLEFLLYMAFWPTVLSGPVCRLGEMLTAFRRAALPNFDDVSAGTRRILSGLFMKLVLAHILANGLEPGEGVNFGFDGLEGGWSGFDAWMLAVAYAMQLYFDFAGYSNIVIGSARLFGIRLRENFQQPFLSTSPSEFWTRWHMSLSSWIRDYVFLPLASLRREHAWHLLALVISMGLFGLWHGATVLFLCWGLYQGVLLVAHRILRLGESALGRSIPALTGKVLGWGFTFASVTLGWLMFRARDIAVAGTMLKAVFTPRGYFHLGLRPNFYLITLLLLTGYFAYIAGTELLARAPSRHPATVAVLLFQPLYYAAAILAIIAWSGRQSVFVYFQF